MKQVHLKLGKINRRKKKKIKGLPSDRLMESVTVQRYIATLGLALSLDLLTLGERMKR